jgi:hypothetical protein
LRQDRGIKRTDAPTRRSGEPNTDMADQGISIAVVPSGTPTLDHCAVS